MKKAPKPDKFFCPAAATSGGNGVAGSVRAISWFDATWPVPGRHDDSPGARKGAGGGHAGELHPVPQRHDQACGQVELGGRSEPALQRR